MKPSYKVLHCKIKLMTMRLKELTVIKKKNQNIVVELPHDRICLCVCI